MIRTETFAAWRNEWEWTAVAVRAYGGKVGPYSIEAPATEDELQAVEAHLGLRLPTAFREVLSVFAKRTDLAWRIRQANDLAPIPAISDGNIGWDIDELLACDVARRSYADIYPEDATTWDHKLAFLYLPNGDLLALALDRPGVPVVYLDHEGGDFHGRVLGPDFPAFITQWSAVGGCGPESWVLERVTGADGIDLDTVDAVSWREWRATFAPEQPRT